MNSSFWEKHFHINHCNIAIIGGGIIGCSIALELAKHFPTQSIFVFERDRIGAGASSKNDGQCLSGGCESYNRMVKTLGRDNAKRITKYKANSVFNINIGDRKVGSCTWAIDNNEKEDLLESYELLKEDKFPVFLLDNKKKIKDYSGSMRFKAGLYFPKDKSINPVKYLYKVYREAVREGVNFINKKEIVEINEEYITDNFGNKIKFDIAVLANNGAAQQLVPKLKDYMWSVRGQVLSTEKVTLEGFASRYCHQTNYGYNYWKVYNDKIILGGERPADEFTEETEEVGINEKIQSALESFISDTYGLSPHIDHRWSGIMCLTRDGAPIVGSLSNMPNVILAVGMCGYGLSYSNSIARSVREIVDNGNYEMNDMLGTKRFGL